MGMLIMGNVEQVISKKWPRLIDACTQLKKKSSKQALSWFLTRNFSQLGCLCNAWLRTSDTVSIYALVRFVIQAIFNNCNVHSTAHARS